MDRKLCLKIAIFLILAGIGVGLFFHYDLELLFTDRKRMIKFITSAGPWSVVAFIGLQALQVLFAPVPGEVTGFIGGYVYGAVLGTVYSTIGLTIGSWLAFTLARMFGLPLVERVVKVTLLQKYDRFIAHQGKLVIFVLFLIPGFPKDALCYIIGLSHLNTVTFLIISATGRLLGTTMLSISGHMVRGGISGALLIPFIIGAIIMGIAYYYRDRWLARITHKDQPPPPRPPDDTTAHDGKYSS